MKAILPFILLLSSLVPLLAQSKNKATAAIELKQGKVIDEHLVSTILKENRIGLNPDRKVKIYLPPGYNSSHQILSGDLLFTQPGEQCRAIVCRW